MAGDLVTFNIRYERSKFVLKIDLSTGVLAFVEKLKSELKVEEDTDKIVVLFPTPDGKMMEIKSDNDIEFLKKTKLSYNSESKEICCSVELVITIIHRKLPDGIEFQIVALSKKVDQFTSQFSQMSRSLDNKIEKSTNFLLTNIKSILQTDFANTAETNVLRVENKLGEPNGSTSFESKPKQKKGKKNKKKLPTGYNTPISTTNDNSPKSNGTLYQEKITVFTKNDPKDIDPLLDMLVKEGFTNSVQNIIALKRFDNNYEKTVEYLKKI